MNFPDLRYDCVQCGKSCGGWRVLVDDASRQRLGERLGYEPFTRGEDGLYRMTFTPDGHCVLQRPDKLCSVHAELGESYKPRTCRQYPFFLVHTPDGPFVGLSFCCTAVKQQAGGPVSAHQAQLEALLREGDYPRVGFGRIAFSPGHSTDWAGYLALEQFLRASLGDPWRMLAVPARAALSTPWETSLGPLVWSELPTPPRNPILDQLEVLLLAGVIGCLEGRDLEEMRRVTAELQRGPTTIRRVPHAVGFACAVNPALDGEIARYLDQLMHRKYLLLGHTVLSRVAALSMARLVLRFYAAAFAAGAVPTSEHLHRALDVVEGEMLTHAPDLEPYFQAAEDGLLRHLG